MRIRTFNAPTIREAQHQVREALGEDAIILSTRDDAAGTVITDAIESDLADEAATAAVASSGRLDGVGEAAVPGLTPEAETLIRALAYHGVPTSLAERLDRRAADLDRGELDLALAAALDDVFFFEPLPLGPPRPLILIGPAGAGKTVAAAKLAARAVTAGGTVAVITTDTVRAGGVEQLAAFTRLLALDLATVEGPRQLAPVAEAAARRGAVIIDSVGTNPYDEAELNALAALVDAAAAEPVLVLPAGGDPAELADQVRRFVLLGARRLLVTRLDAARRYGGMLAAADAGGLSFAQVSIAPFVGQGLHALNPVSLARMLLRDPTEPHVSSEFDKVEP